jgi:recombination protein RecR
MSSLEPLAKLCALLARLPGVGRRSAERMALALVRDGGALAGDLASAIQDVKQRVVACSRCGNTTLKSDDPCRLCTDPRRDDSIVCVVEDPSDIAVIERAGAFKGRYHALMGKLSPQRGEGFDSLRLDSLLQRVERDHVKEVILALNADVESDATASFIRQALTGRLVRVTRLARGIPAGSGLAYTDSVTLGSALANREAF